MVPAGRLVLWDIDGTLLRAGVIARECFDQAVEAVTGSHPGPHDVAMSGKTDPQIAREILAYAGVPDASGLIAAVIEHMEEILAGAVEVIQGHGRVLPGVVEILDRLAAEPAVHQTVLTGNTRRNAATKLTALGLADRLDLEAGAYGSDEEDRLRLLPVALERARRLRDLDVAPESVWIVGDTERDLACARAGGARCLLVGTGRIPLADLEAAGADVVLPDLADADRVVALLCGAADAAAAPGGAYPRDAG